VELLFLDNGYKWRKNSVEVGRSVEQLADFAHDEQGGVAIVDLE
jgi:hypothetical protein